MDPHLRLFIIANLMVGPLSHLPLPLVGIEGGVYEGMVNAILTDLHRAIHMAQGGQR